MTVGVTVSVTAAMESQHFEYYGSSVPNQTSGTATNVRESNFATTTFTDSDAVGPNTQAGTPRMHPISMQYVEGSACQGMCAVNSGQVLYPVFTVEEIGTLNTTASGEHYFGDTTATTFTQLENTSAQGVSVGQLLAQENGAYVTQQDVSVDMTTASL
jgi:hypothetical protein